jgi:hypothetical protein
LDRILLFEFVEHTVIFEVKLIVSGAEARVYCHVNVVLLAKIDA